MGWIGAAIKNQGCEKEKMQMKGGGPSYVKSRPSGASDGAAYQDTTLIKNSSLNTKTKRKGEEKRKRNKSEGVKVTHCVG